MTVLKTTSAAVLVATLFLFFAGPGFKAWFTDDQLMNLYFASDKPVLELALQPDRPVATLTMRALWEIFGFHPRPYRVVCFTLLFFNLALATALVWRLARSGTTALLFAIPFAYHACLTDLYFSTATLYDILCFTFTFFALFWYVTIRSQSRVPRWYELAGLCMFSALAIGSKEMAVTLPLLLALIEWLYGDRRHWLGPILSASVCAALLARFFVQSGFQLNSAYRSSFTPEVFWSNWQHYQALLLYQVPTWSPIATKLTLALCLLTPFLLRRRESWLASAVALLTPLPILFIAPRSFYAFYIPYFGFCLLAASALSTLAIRRWVPATLAVAVTLLLIPRHLAYRDWANGWYYEQERILCEPGKMLRRSLPKLEPGSRVLFVEDPLPPPPDMEHQLFFYVALITNDHSIRVDRAKFMRTPPAESEWVKYAAVFQLTRKQLVRLH